MGKPDPNKAAPQIPLFSRLYFIVTVLGMVYVLLPWLGPFNFLGPLENRVLYSSATGLGSILLILSAPFGVGVVFQLGGRIPGALMILVGMWVVITPLIALVTPAMGW